MKTTRLTIISLSAAIMACSSPKKSSTSTAPTATPPPVATSPTTAPAPVESGPGLPPGFLASIKTGINPPGDPELAAIQSTYKEVTMQTLQDGYKLYTGDCTKCHMAFSIYRIEEQHWKGLIDDMARRAEMTASQKDAVYKYVLAVKATQPK